MVISTKAIYRFYVIHIKIPATFFPQLEKKTKFIWKKIEALNSQNNTIQKELSGNIPIQYRAIVTKTTQYHRQVDQRNRIKDPEISSHSYSHLYFDIHWTTSNLFNECC